MTSAIEKDPRAEAAIRAWQELKGARTEHEQDWMELGQLLRPSRGGFTAADPGAHRREKILNSAGIIAAQNFSAGLHGTLTNSANRWFALTTPDERLRDFQPMREWLDIASRRLLLSFAPANSPFYSAAAQLFGDVSVFGNAAQYDEQPPGETGFLDVTLSMAECCYDIDAYGRVTEVIRKFRLTPTAAAQRYGYDPLPEKLRELADKGSRDRVTFYHHVGRNHAWRRGKLGPTGKRWFSIHAAEEGGTVLRHGGYDDMPFFAPRWDVETGQVYARGPGWTALPAGRKLELMTAANLRAGQRAADPTLLAPSKEDWPLSGRVRPGAMIYGGVDMAGRQLVRTLDTTARTGLSLEMQQQAVEEMRDAHHWSLMNLAGRTGMTATEVIERQEEKLRLMAPHLGRIQEEYLAPKIARRFALLWKAGQMPPPPPEAAGSPLTVEYTSAAAMAAHSAEGAATVRLLSDLGPLAQVKPDVLDRLSEDDIVEVLAEARGAPARLLRSRDEAGQMRAARAEQQQAAAMLEAAQAGGGIARDLAAAQPAGAA